MGEIYRIGKIKFSIISGDHNPSHVHIYSNGNTAKIGIDDGECYFARGFSQKELNHLEKIVKENKDFFIMKWREINEND